MTRTVAFSCVLTLEPIGAGEGPVALEGTRFTFWRPLSAMLSSD